MTKIIGLTGGIGSGKSAVAQLFITHGVPVYIADVEAKKLMQSQTILKKIKIIFGDSVFDDKKINRAKLAAIVFKEPEKLAQLNAIIHPAVHEHFIKWVKKHRDYPYIIKEVAILFETGGEKYCDKVITVVAPASLRLQRVIKRDNATEEAVLARMNNQWTDEQRILKSDFVIENIDFEQTKQEVDEILKVLNNL
ncbi:dephospho-CoA kinase [Flavobacterium sp.]|uniref:dephospho-CoA kinase n=1 Tax=Flavobacterium sp. TaxID=239 RepID=UPI0026297D19|nr:dephospho-CoA kinase [Flavobacterium sp.]MDD2986744.1 dephospho-CoA kinase [Flavobacterium sp.]